MASQTERVNSERPATTARSLRAPARQLCQLDAPDFKPPTDDFNELSRFLRLSTCPGYSLNRSDTVSEYNSNYSNEVLSTQKDKIAQGYKMKRDWLSNWGEFNVIEQRWRKAWVEKFGSGEKK